MRRLIFVAARNIVLEPPAERPARAKSEISVKAKAETTVRKQRKRRRRSTCSTRVLDPNRIFWPPAQAPQGQPPHYFHRYDPRIPEFLRAQFLPPAPVPRSTRRPGESRRRMVNAKHLVRRLVAVMDALQDIPRQAMRLAALAGPSQEERRPERWSPVTELEGPPDSASAASTKSTTSSRNATGSPAMSCRRSTTRRKGRHQLVL